MMYGQQNIKNTNSSEPG